MTSIEELKIMNYTKIACLQDLGKNSTRNQLIKQLLKDEACFFKIKKSDALIILHDIGISDDNIEEIYYKLVSRYMFCELIKKNKIKEDDSELKIRYKISSTNKMLEKNISEDVRKDNYLIVKPKETFFEKILNKIKKILKR